MEKKKESTAYPEMLESIFINYNFFFRTFIKSDKIELTNSEIEELQTLIDERDYFSIKQFMHKSRQ